MTLSSREKTIFGFCVVSGVGALLYVFALEPILMSWEKTNREIRRSEIRMEKTSKIAKEKEILETKLKEVAGGAKSGIPKAEWGTALLSSLDKMAGESGVAILKRESRPGKEYGFYEELLAELEVECDLGTLSKFLYQMEISDQILNVETLRLSPKGRGSSRLSAQISFSAIQLIGSRDIQ